MSYIQKFNNVAKARNTRDLHTLFNKKLFLIFLITLAIPVTVFLSSQQQNLQKQAAETSGPRVLGYIIEFKDQSITQQLRGTGSTTSTASTRPIGDRRIELVDKQKLYKANILTILGKTSYKPASSISSASTDEIVMLGEYTNVINGIALQITQEQAEKLKAESPYVKAVYPNYEVKAQLNQSVPLIGADRIWTQIRDPYNRLVTGKGVIIAIVDSGVDYRHPDLGGSGAGQIFNSKVIGGFDFINSIDSNTDGDYDDVDDIKDSDPMDDNRHGTHVAAIAAGTGVLKGVAPGANIIAYKVLDENALGSFATIISGIDAAVDTRDDNTNANDVSVINLSAGAYCGTYSANCGPDDILSRSVDNATSRGITVVVAAGNFGDKIGAINTPGTARTALTVGSVNKGKIISSFSSRGPVVTSNANLQKPDVLAPGEDICAARFSGYSGEGGCLDNSHMYLSGTSMATPHVAGLAALVKQKNPGFGASEIKDLIVQKATSLGYDINTQGKGIVDSGKIFDFSTPPPTTPPTLNPVISNPPSPEPIITIIPSQAPTQTISITSYQDSYVASNKSTVNYGGSPKLYIGTNPKRLAFLKFDLKPLAGKKIISAKLKLTIPSTDGSGSVDKFNVRKVDISKWTESSVKYSNKPDLTALVSSFTGKGAGSSVLIDVKSFVEQGVGRNVSLGIGTEGANDLVIYSIEANSGKPQLIIQYQ